MSARGDGGGLFLRDPAQRQALAAMLGVCGMGGWRFGPADARAMRGDALTLCRAMTQKVGWGRAGDPACVVTASELDGAVARLLCASACLALSGELDALCGEGAPDGGDD